MKHGGRKGERPIIGLSLSMDATYQWENKGVTHFDKVSLLSYQLENHTHNFDNPDSVCSVLVTTQLSWSSLG